MQTHTHIVVGVEDNNSLLKQAARGGKFSSEMEIIAWCQNTADAGIIQRTWEQGDEDHKKRYYVIEEKK